MLRKEHQCRLGGETVVWAERQLVAVGPGMQWQRSLRPETLWSMQGAGSSAAGSSVRDGLPVPSAQAFSFGSQLACSAGALEAAAQKARVTLRIPTHTLSLSLCLAMAGAAEAKLCRDTLYGMRVPPCVRRTEGRCASGMPHALGCERWLVLCQQKSLEF